MNKYINGYIISIRIVSLYDKLREYSYNNITDTEEYYTCIEEIKKLIKLENNEYNKLDISLINNYLDNICQEGIDNPYDERYYLKLLNHKKRIVNKENNSEDSIVSMIIDSKIQIDVLKKINELIYTCNTFNYDEELFLNELISYHEASKYTYLTSNNYLELLSLYSDFNIEKIPTLSFEKIEEEYNLSFIEESQPIFIDSITFSIDNLFKLDDNNNNIEKVYTMLYNFSEIEVFLSYLTLNSLKIISDYYENNLKNCKGSIARTNIKRLINNRKKDFTAL